jgi:hypothetical protein
MYVSAVYKPACIVRSSLKLDLVLESQLLHSSDTVGRKSFIQLYHSVTCVHSSHLLASSYLLKGASICA